jgi:hypothetical protein
VILAGEPEAMKRSGSLTGTTLERRSSQRQTEQLVITSRVEANSESVSDDVQ